MLFKINKKITKISIKNKFKKITMICNYFIILKRS